MSPALAACTGSNRSEAITAAPAAPQSGAVEKTSCERLAPSCWAAATPGLGSFTEYVRRGLGEWGGFVGGWLYWYFWVVVVAIEAIAGAAILAQWFPLPIWQIGLVLMAVLVVVIHQ